MEVQVVIRAREVCACCGAIDSFVRGRGGTTFRENGKSGPKTLVYGHCKYCGAPVKIYYR